MFNKSFLCNHRNIRKLFKQATVKLFRRKPMEVTKSVTERKQESTAAHILLQEQGTHWGSVVYHRRQQGSREIK